MMMINKLLLENVQKLNVVGLKPMYTNIFICSDLEYIKIYLANPY